MTKDITYCSSTKCLKTNTCSRWWLNNTIHPKDTVSMFDPYRKNKECLYYMDKED